jgi:Fic family protein
MIVNNYRAMEQIRDIDTLELTPETVLQLQRIVTDGTLDDTSAAGRLRRADEAVTVDDYEGNLLHDPPPAASLPERLERLCAFANRADDVEPFVHPVLKAILLHFMLAYDHPFVDGNGRTARALFYRSLVGHGYWLMEYVSISRLLHRAPTQYARAFLLTESDGLDTTYFLLHQLDVIERAIADLHDYLTRKGAEQRSAERLLTHAPGLADRLNHRQVALLGHALRHPGFSYSVASHRRSHRVTSQTARTDLLKLAVIGLLDKRKRGRAFLFRAPDDLRARIEAAASLT